MLNRIPRNPGVASPINNIWHGYSIFVTIGEPALEHQCWMSQFIYISLIHFLPKVLFLLQYAIQSTVFYLSAMTPWAPFGCDSFFRISLLCALFFYRFLLSYIVSALWAWRSDPMSLAGVVVISGLKSTGVIMTLLFSYKWGFCFIFRFIFFSFDGWGR